MELAAGILFALLIATPGALAMAQDVKQPSEANVSPTDPPEHHECPSTKNGETASGIPSDDSLPVTSRLTIPVSHSAAPAPEQQRSTTTSTASSPDAGLGDGCLPTCNNCPWAYVEVEAVFMDREPRLARQPIIVDANTGTTFLTTSDLDFGFDPGLRATIGTRLRDGWALEFSYFGLFQGNASAVAISPDADAFLIFPNNLFGNVFVGMDGATVNYSSLLNSFELNLPCCCGCCDECRDECDCSGRGDRCGRGAVRCQSFEWFAGLRYLNLNERLDIAAQRTVSGGVEQGTYDIRTTNNLFGAQLGARWRRSKGRIGWEVTGKAGAFGNTAQESQTVIDFPNFPLRNASRSGGEAAFVGEVNLSAFYRLTDIWDLRAGYGVMWIEGLALAPDQLDFNFATSPSGDQLHNGGSIFLHGVNVGLEARW